jgi:hypothetical protein
MTTPICNPRMNTLPRLRDHTAELAAMHDLNALLALTLLKKQLGPMVTDEPDMCEDWFTARRIVGATRASVVGAVKAAAAPLTTTDAAAAGPLAPSTAQASAFVAAALRPSVLARLGALRVPVAKVTGAVGITEALAYWHGEGKPKPVSTMTFDPLSLEPRGVIAQVVVSNELVRFASIDLIAGVQTRLVQAVTRKVNTAFLDPTNSGVAGQTPASVTAGVTPLVSGGGDLLADVAAVLGALSNGAPERPTLVLSHANALRLRVQDLQAQGVNVVVDAAAGDYIIGIDAAFIRYMDDGVREDLTAHASVEMRSDPTDPGTASTVMTSLWQRNAVGVRAELFVNWWAAPGAVALMEL